MRPFPDPKEDPLLPNAELQQAFDEAMASSPQPPRSAPIVIVAIDPNGPPHAVAGQRGAEVHYSASLLKVAAMYAAFELRSAASELLAELEFEGEEVAPVLAAEFDGAIEETRVPQLASLATKFLLPKYDQMFSFEPATATLDFSQSFKDHLFGAIALGKNDHAAECIHGVGFGYLTQALAEAGFLDPLATASPATADGIWLCGDFSFGYPPQRIPCVNDTPVAQATSANQMARLLTLMLDGSLVGDGVGDEAMRGLLEEAFVNHLFWLEADPTIHFTTQATKIGEGAVNSGPPLVASEALVIEETSTGRTFVVVFQNLRLAQKPASVFAVARVVDQTIAAFPVT